MNRHLRTATSKYVAIEGSDNGFASISNCFFSTEELLLVGVADSLPSIFSIDALDVAPVGKPKYGPGVGVGTGVGIGVIGC